jgi:hypothetical protein
VPGKGKIDMTKIAQGASQGNRSVPIFTDPLIVAEWLINRRDDSLRVSLENYQTSRLVNIRKWYVDDNGQKRPTKRGIALSLAQLPRLAAALNEALRIATELGLIETNSGN